MLLPAILSMAALVVASNILVQFVIAGGLLTWGAFTYPFTFLLVDIVNRARGPSTARVVVLWGFATGVLCSLIGSQITLELGPAVPLRVAIASGAAFVLAQFLDVAIFHHFRTREWWRAPLASSLLSSTLDTMIFFGLAFSLMAAPLFPDSADAAVSWAQGPAPFLGVGPLTPLWASLAVADFVVKVALALVALGPYRFVAQRLQQHVI